VAELPLTISTKTPHYINRDTKRMVPKRIQMTESANSIPCPSSCDSERGNVLGGKDGVLPSPFQ